MTPIGRLVCVGVLLALAAACGPRETSQRRSDIPSEPPEKLSDWGVLAVKRGALRLSEPTVPYELATPLFSDYALKLRTVTLPPGESAAYHETAVFEFPVGTVITKTFYYPAKDAVLLQGEPTSLKGSAQSGYSMPLKGYRLIETRVLVRRDTGWQALPYLWNDDQKEAVLKRTGAIVPITLQRSDGRQEKFAYLAPNQNQCAGCHATDSASRALHPIGPKARNLNTASPLLPEINQLDHWKAKGLVTASFDTADAPRNAVWTDKTEPLDARTRAYLDINCSHCHSAKGPADTSGLNYEPHIALGPSYGLCKSPIAAGGGSGGRPFDLVPGAPSQSIMAFRLESTDPGAMMPELGRAIVHEEGAALISEWIASLAGGCT